MARALRGGTVNDARSVLIPEAIGLFGACAAATARTEADAPSWAAWRRAFVGRPSFTSALGESDAAGVQVDVVDADAEQLGDPDSGEQQGLDEEDVLAFGGRSTHLVVAADLGLSRDVGEALRLPLLRLGEVRVAVG